MIQEEYKIWVPVAKVCGYVVQFRPYPGVKKGKQVASSTKCGLGENVVLWLMACLTAMFSFEIFICNCFTSFRLYTYELIGFEQQVCSTIVYRHTWLGNTITMFVISQIC